MIRILSLSAAAAVSGLQVSQEPMQLLGSRLESGVVKASAGADPEFINSRLEKFNVPIPGEFHAIQKPPDDGAELGVNCTLEDVGRKECDDLLIRHVKITGTKLGACGSSLEFFISSENFNNSDALGIQLDGVNKTVAELLADCPACSFDRPRSIQLPVKDSVRHRTKMYRARCEFGTTPYENTVTVIWNSVWRKYMGDVYYQNDMDFFVSNVGDASGLLGTDDHDFTQQWESECNNNANRSYSR